VEAEPADDGPDIISALDRWRRRSAFGAMLAGFGFTLRDVLKAKQEDPVIAEVEPSGPGGPDEPLEIHLDPDYPALSWAVVRPHAARARASRLPGRDVDELGG
jgi:hypothetical protein